jgi:4-amino-4-deoxy-L-arabinose transferase-like glycosyltransferase
LRRSPLLLLLLLTLIGCAPLLAPGYFLRAHDAAHSLFWLVEFDQGIGDGFLWPRWAADHVLGYGYPLFTFYAPLAFFIAEGFHLLGAGIAAAVKLTWALAFLLSGFTMYRFAGRLWGAGAGFVAGLLYAFAPYHLVNIYVRAALAEFVAYALFPWVLYCFWDLIERGGRRRLALAGLSLGLTLLTHSVTLLIFPPFLIGLILYWLLLRWRQSRRFPWRQSFAVLLAGLLAGGVATIFLLPALAESSYIVQSQWLPDAYNYAKQYLYLYQLFSPEWGFGHALPGPDDGMSQQIGLWLLVLGLAALPLLWRTRPARRGLLAGFLSAALIAILGMLAVTQPLWAALPPLALIQFPFRLLAMADLFLALVVGAMASALLPRLQASETPAAPLPAAALAIGLAIVLASYPYTRPEHTPVSARSQSPAAITDFELAFPDMRGSTAFAGQPPTASPKLDAYLTGKTLPLAGIITGEGEVTPLRHGGGSERVRVIARTPITLQFYTYWYPGWQGTANGEEIALRSAGPDALITLDLPAGEHDVSIRFGNTPLRTTAALISLLSLLVLITILFLDYIAYFLLRISS